MRWLSFFPFSFEKMSLSPLNHKAMSTKLIFIQKHTPGKQYGQPHFFISRSGNDLGFTYEQAEFQENLLAVLVFNHLDYFRYLKLTRCLYQISYWESRIDKRKIRRLEINDLERIYLSGYYDSLEFSQYKNFKKLDDLKRCLFSPIFYKILLGRFSRRLFGSHK